MRFFAIGRSGLAAATATALVVALAVPAASPAAASPAAHHGSASSTDVPQKARDAGSSDATSSAVLDAAATAGSSAAASSEAESIGEPVEDLSRRTATSSSYVLPGGRRVFREWAGPVHAKDSHGTWAKIDTKLRKSGSSIVPGPTATRATLSTGRADLSGSAGTSPLTVLSLPAGPKTFGLRWPRGLGEPTLSGSTASYTDKTSGTQLVLDQQPDGVEFSVVLTRRPTGSTEIALPLSAEGLSFTSTKWGGIQVHLGSAIGPQVGEITPPQMFDGKKDIGGRLSSNLGSVTMKVESRSGTPTLVLDPDPAYLSSPQTTYPVTIDPTMETFNGTGEGDSETSDYVFTDYSGDLQNQPFMSVGQIDTSHVAHAFFQFHKLDANSLGDGAVVISASVAVWETLSVDATTYNNCTDLYSDPGPQWTSANGLNIYQIAAPWSPPIAFWPPSDPRNTTKYPFQPSPVNGMPPLATNWATKGGDATYCPAGSMVFPNLRTTVQNWLNSPGSNYGFELGPVCEASSCTGSSAGERRSSSAPPMPEALAGQRTIASAHSLNPPSITVLYALPPEIGDFGATIDGVSSYDGNTYTSARPTLVAEVGDPDSARPGGAPVDPNVSFSVTKGGATIFPQGGDDPVGTPDTYGDRYKTIPTSGSLVDGAVYTAQATPSYSTWGQTLTGDTATYNFVVDSQPPTSPPSVSSTDVRVNDWTAPDNRPTPGLLSKATFALTGYDNHGVGGYNISLDGQPAVKIGNETGAGDSLTHAVVTNINSGWHVLTASTVDLGGNVGPATTFSFGVGAGSVGANRTWKNVLLTPAASADKTGVTYSWKVAGSSSPYVTLPLSAVTNNGSPIGNWPVPPTGTGASAVWPKLVWNAAATLGTAFGGLISVQATYATTTGSPLSVQSTVELDRSPFGGSYATAKVGPGTLAETTGDLDVSAGDVNAPGYADALTFGRDLTTLKPGGTGNELLSAQQQDVEGSATLAASDFTGINSTISQSAAQAFSGTKSLAITGSTGSRLSYATLGGELASNTMRAGMTAGNSYTLTAHEYVPSSVLLSTSTDSAIASQGLRAVVYYTTAQGTFRLLSDAPSAQNSWSTVSLTFRLPAGTTAAAIRLYNGSATAGTTTYWDGLSLRQAQFGTTAATKVLGPGWLASLPGASSGLSQDTISDDTASTGQVVLTDPDGQITGYMSASGGPSTCDSCSYYGVAEAAYDGSTLVKDVDSSNSLPRLTLTGADGSITLWESPNASGGGDNGWRVVSATGPGAHDAVRYLYDITGRVTDAYSANPTPTGSSTPITCTPVSSGGTSRGLVPGCRDMVLVYSPSTTTIPTGSTTGAYPGQLAEVDYYTFDPNNSAQVIKTAMASYAYDSSGHLRSEWDPRLSTPLKTAYSYTGANGNGVSTDPAARLSAVTPAGLGATTLAYTGTGQLQASSQALPASQSAVTTVAYNVPTDSGAVTKGLPEIDATTAPAWNQGGTDPGALPATATALFRADHIPTMTSGVPLNSDWPYATISYINNDGRPTNVANYGVVNGQAKWNYGATLYDAFTGNVTASLTASNRDHAITTGLPGADPYADGQPTPSARAALLSTVNSYSPDGIDLLKTLGPLHLAKNAGTLTELRSETDNTYDAGSPNNVKYHLVTTSTATAQLVGTAAPDSRTTTYSYDPIVAGDTSGWTLRKPTKVVTGDQTRITRYDADGRVIETRMPSDADGSTPAGSTITRYYTADASSPDSDCRNQAPYAGWICKTLPGALTTSTKAAGAQPPLDVTWTQSYNPWGEALSTVTYSCTSSTYSACATAPTRTSAATFDGAGRPTLVHATTTNESTGQASAAIPDQATTYDPATGLQTCVAVNGPTCTSAVSTFTSAGTPTLRAVLSRYDSAGRTIATTDGETAVTATSYDIDSRPTTVKECLGTDPSRSTCAAGAYASSTVYTYDGTVNEHRGVVTSENANLGGSNPSTFTATYDANGALATETYPSGAVKTISSDSAGDTTQDDYNFNGGHSTYSAVPNVFGETASQSNPSSSQSYGYDLDGRLTSVADTDRSLSSTGSTFTRTYSYNANSDRLTAGLSTLYSSKVTSDGPAAYWRLNETSGTTAADSSGNTNTGTYSSTGPTHGTVGATPGNTNLATTFAGTGDHVSAPAASWNEQNGSFTDEIWLTAPTNASSFPAIMGQGRDSTNANGWAIYDYPGGYACMTINSDGYCESKPLLATAGWHLLDVTYSASTNLLSFYVDGQLDNSYTPNPIHNTNTTGTFNVGSSGGDGTMTSSYQGSLDDAALYTKALTGAQIAQHYQTAQMGIVVQGSSTSPHQYDEADRLVDTGYSYDPFGRTLTVPSKDANNAGTLSLSYYSNDLVAQERLGSGDSRLTTAYTVDPLYRTDITTNSTGTITVTTTGTSTQHYATTTSGGNESASWVATTTGSTNSWTRNIAGLDGTLAATLTNTGTATEIFTNLQGSIAAAAPDVTNSSPTTVPDSLEFGQTRPTTPPGTPTPLAGQGPNQYGWLGGHTRDQNSLAGLTLMGERLYNPTTGRFLQTDPIPGGSCNNYDYTCQNPVSGSDLSGKCGFFGLPWVKCKPQIKSGQSADFCANVGCIHYELTPYGRVGWGISIHGGVSGVFLDVVIRVNGKVVDEKKVYAKGMVHGTINPKDLPAGRDNVVSISAEYVYPCYIAFTCTAYSVPNGFLVPKYYGE